MTSKVKAEDRKSEVEGASKKDAPVSNTIGTELEAAVAGVVSTTVGEATTVGATVAESTVEATGVANEEVRSSPMRVSNR